MSCKCLNLAILLALSSAAGAGAIDWEAEDSRGRRIPDVVYIPTPEDVVDAMLQLAEIGRDDVVYDLGCGDGRILIAAARTFGCRAVGYDIDPLRIEAARKNIRENKLEHLVHVEQKDLFDVDLRSATVVTLYLSAGYNRRLIPQLRGMPSGARIVSHQFGIHGLVPDKVIRMKSRHDPHFHVLYRWTAPKKGSGLICAKHNPGHSGK